MNRKDLTEVITSLWNVKVIIVIFLWAFNVGSANTSDKVDSFHCPASFHGNCRCYTNGEAHNIVNCTDSNLANTNMLEYLPIDTEVLIFTGNNVFDLPLNIFGNIGEYRSLKMIDLSNNHIQTIKGRTFHNVENVKLLMLNDNDIYLNGKDNHPRMFSNFDSLEELHLRNTFTEKLTWNNETMGNLKQIFDLSKLNRLRVLNLEKNEFSSFSDRNFFCALPSLQELKLADNHLTEFNVNIKCLLYLKILDLSRNLISYFNDETLSSFELIPLLKIDLNENPFRCDCSMIDLYGWISKNETNLISFSRYRCKDGFPPRNIGLLLSNLTRNDLLCPYSVHEVETNLSAVYVIISLIIIAMITLIITVIIYKNKRLLHDVFYRISLNIRRKFQYDSLDKAEETEMEV